MIFVPFFIFAFGLIIGSFLNVVIIRMNTGRSVVTGRSKCASCSRVLTWYELIPVFSFLGLRGKCRTCRAPLSFQYPLVELATGIVFLGLYTKLVIPHFFSSFAWVDFLGASVIACMFIIILVYDYRHKIIPDTIMYPLLLLSVISVVWHSFTLPGFSIPEAIIEGVIVASPFFFLWYLSRGRLMGFGDVKLALAMGWFLGISQAGAAFLVSFWIGGLVGLFLLGLSRRYHLKSQIPFAPFLIAGFCIVYFAGLTLFSFFPGL